VFWLDRLSPKAQRKRDRRGMLYRCALCDQSWPKDRGDFQRRYGRIMWVCAGCAGTPTPEILRERILHVQRMLGFAGVDGTASERYLRGEVVRGEWRGPVPVGPDADDPYRTEDGMPRTKKEARAKAAVEHQGGDFVCGECGEEFERAQALGAHRRYQHPAAAKPREGRTKTSEEREADRLLEEASKRLPSEAGLGTALPDEVERVGRPPAVVKNDDLERRVRFLESEVERAQQKLAARESQIAELEKALEETRGGKRPKFCAYCGEAIQAPNGT